MSDKWMEYVNDPRTICKYGSRCYQKNSDHHNKYKHPPQGKELKRHKRRYEPYAKPKDSNEKKHEYEIPDDVVQNHEEKETVETDTSRSKDSRDIKNDNNDSTASAASQYITEENLTAVDNIDVKQQQTDHSEDNNSCDTNDAASENRNESDIPYSPLKLLSPSTVTFHDKSSDPAIYKDLFLVKMPEDFFKFFDFLNKQEETVDKLLGSVDLELIGPYDLMLGKLPVAEDRGLYLIHWRFFYDPPEFQAVLKKKNSEFHIGYFRDDPNENPVFVGSSDSARDCHITPTACNIFGALYLHLQNEKKRSPFTAVVCQKIMNNMKKYAEENKISLEGYSVKKRLSKVVTKTFHGAGIAVPYEKKTQLGYRPLVETDANLKKLFKSLQNASSQSEKDNILSELQPVITYASIAVDECDFGTGLEAGIDLFCSGLKELEPSALSSLTTAYMLLNRTAFCEIIKAHLRKRRKGPNMSIIEG